MKFNNENQIYDIVKPITVPLYRILFLSIDQFKLLNYIYIVKSY